MLLPLFAAIAIALAAAECSASSIYVDRTFKDPSGSASWFPKLFDRADDMIFSVRPDQFNPNILWANARSADYPQGSSLSINLQFAPGGPIDETPERFDGVKTGPGATPWMSYSIGTGAVTNAVGWFEILDFALATDGSISRFHVDWFLSSPSIFERQYDSGRLRFDSIPTPTAASLAALACVGALIRRRSWLWPATR